jgi:hypothetical protein
MEKQMINPAFLAYCRAFASGAGAVLAIQLFGGHEPTSTTWCTAIGAGLIATGFFRLPPPNSGDTLPIRSAAAQG